MLTSLCLHTRLTSALLSHPEPSAASSLRSLGLGWQLLQGQNLGALVMELSTWEILIPKFPNVRATSLAYFLARVANHSKSAALCQK